MNAVAPGHPNLALQAVPGESPFFPGMAFAVVQLRVSRKNCLDTQKCADYKALLTTTYKPIGFTEGGPGLRVWFIPAREVRRYSPVIPKRILDEEATHFSLRYRSDLISPQVSCEADSE